MKRAISKVLAELQKEAPDLSYIRGLLEGAVEEELPIVLPSGRAVPSDRQMLNHVLSDEQEIIPQSVRVGPVGDLA